MRQYSYEDLNQMRISKGELFHDIDITFDYALPQEWLDKFADWCIVNYPIVTYHLIRSTTVWAYTKGSLFGEPLTVCIEVDNALDTYKLY